MLQKKILVPWGPTGTGLRSLHYAVSLAKRLGGRVYVLQLQKGRAPVVPGASETGEGLAEVLNSARLAGLSISHHLADDSVEEEIIDFVKKEEIDLLVFAADDADCVRMMRRIRPRVTSQIIQVREKNSIDYL